MFRSNLSRANCLRGILWGNFPGREEVLHDGEFFGSNSSGGKNPRGNCLGENFMGSNCLGYLCRRELFGRNSLGDGGMGG